MSNQPSAATFRTILCACLTLAVAGFAYLLISAPPRADASRPLRPQPAPQYLYFPFIPNVTQGIHGRVNDNGTPAANVVLSMRYYDGLAFSTIATTTTDTNGNYYFTGIPGLTGVNKEYHVRYQNPGPDLNRLWSWSTRAITTYVSGADVAIGNFDLANISLVDPAPDATIALPYRFQWTPRAATPSDNYEVDMFDPLDRNPWWWTSHLGYVNSTLVSSLGSDFGTGVSYGWDVWAYSPDGGYGESHYYNRIQFVRVSASPASPYSPLGGTPSAPRDWYLREAPEHAAP